MFRRKKKVNYKEYLMVLFVENDFIGNKSFKSKTTYNEIIALLEKNVIKITEDQNTYVKAVLDLIIANIEDYHEVKVERMLGDILFYLKNNEEPPINEQTLNEETLIQRANEIYMNLKEIAKEGKRLNERYKNIKDNKMFKYETKQLQLELDILTSRRATFERANIEISAAIAKLAEHRNAEIIRKTSEETTHINAKTNIEEVIQIYQESNENLSNSLEGNKVIEDLRNQSFKDAEKFKSEVDYSNEFDEVTKEENLKEYDF